MTDASNPSDDCVLFHATPDGVATITLNRPEVHNAFNAEMIERLADILEDLHGADGIRAVLVEGAGKSFSAGADLNWMRHAAEQTFEDNLEDARALGMVLHHLATLPQPTIALARGAVYGGGVGLVAACDIAIAVADATFSLSEVRLGLVPAVISPYVVAAMGARAARRYMLTGIRFGADEARRAGLVHELVERPGDLAAAARPIIDALFEAAPGAVTECKRLIARVEGRALDEHLVDETARLIAHVRASEEAREGIAAFLEKRRPAWRG